MNLDHHADLKQLDTQNMLGEIDNLPDQLGFAYQLGMKHDLPEWKDFRQVVIAGMGSSAIGADLLAAYCAALVPLPVSVHRDYGLPLFARGPETLVICCSHSGNTEETLESFEAAHQAGCRLIVVTTGGKLLERAKAHQIPVWTFEHKGQPCAAIGFSFGLLLAMFQRLGLLPDQKDALDGALAAMRKSQEHLKVEVPTTSNPAKRYAGQLMGRWVTVVGAGLLAPVARRWKGQINELARSGANFDSLPEANHNTLAGTMYPEDVLNAHTMTIFLRAPSDHPRNRLRTELTKNAFLLEGMNTDLAEARGKTPLAHMWTLILFGDYMAYYLAMCYEIDRTTIQALVEFKQAMAEAE